MAVQFPNFLAAQLVKPDYSGIGDLFNNYYGGKALRQQDIIGQNQAQAAPLELLMKQIQAEFARPSAEAALSGAKLGNQGKSLSNQQAGLQLQQLKRQIAEQAAIENQIKAAMAAANAGGQGGGMQGGGGFGGSAAQIPDVEMPQQNMYQPIKMNDMGEALKKVMGQPMMQGQAEPATPPLMNDHPAEMERQSQRNNERIQELEAGTSSLYGIDRLWDMNPLARPYLEKKGYKKEVKRETDKKSGIEKIYTKWPSGKITVKSIMPEQEDTGDEIPLTKPGLVKVEDEIRGTDSLLPFLDKLITMSKPRNVVRGVSESDLPLFEYSPTNAGSEYRTMKADALESYMASSKLPRTDTSIKKVDTILSRGYGEDDRAYHNRLIRKRKELLEKRDKNITLMKKGTKRFGNDTSSAADYSTEELRAMYNEE